MLLAAAAAIMTVGVLRVAWAQPRRSAALNALGWGTLALALVAAALAEGAWGVTVASLFAMGAALIAVGLAAYSSPKGRTAASARRVNMLPEAGEKMHVGRRVGTFLMVSVGGLLVSVLLALAVRGLGGALGWQEADSNATAVFAVPIAWGLIAYLILMQQRRRAQFLVLLAGALPALPAVVTGFI